MPPKAAIVVIQEIFGVNHHIRAVCDRLANEGYIAIAPSIFDRVERNFLCGYSPEEVTVGGAQVRCQSRRDSRFDEKPVIGPRLARTPLHHPGMTPVREFRTSVRRRALREAIRR